jgi:hypothetical protein
VRVLWLLKVEVCLSHYISSPAYYSYLALQGLVKPKPITLSNFLNQLTLPLTAVSASILDQLQFFSQYSAAAYCLGNNDSPNTKITCPQGNCARVEAANTNTLTEFQKFVF